MQQVQQVEEEEMQKGRKCNEAEQECSSGTAGELEDMQKCKKEKQECSKELKKRAIKDKKIKNQ